MGAEPARVSASSAAAIGSTREIELSELHAAVEQLASRNLRLVTMTAIDAGDTFELYYHFADLDALEHLHMVVDRESVVPSISGIYFAAFLVENEIKELFGVNITGLAIDYNGRLLLDGDMPPHPMRRDSPSASASS